MKRIVLLLAAVIIGICGIVPGGLSYTPVLASPAPTMQYFPVDLRDHWAYESLSDFIQAGILQGNESHEGLLIRPDARVTRAEFVAILLRAAGIPMQQGTIPFHDVKPNDWYIAPITTAYKLGVVNGTNADSFSPNRSITRAEIAAVLVRFFQQTIRFEGKTVSFADISNHWAKAEIELAGKASIVDGYEGGLFQPASPATRAEAVTMISRTLRKESGQVPEDGTLTELVKREFDDTTNRFAAGEIDTPNVQPSQYGIGFYSEVLAAAAQFIAIAKENGFTINYRYEGEPQWKVIHKSNRFAVVEETGYTEIVEYRKGTYSNAITTPHQETYLLRLVDGAWKIYGVQDFYKKQLLKLTAEPFTMNVAVKDSVMHPSKPILYVLDDASNEIVSLNYDTGKEKRYKLHRPGEKLFWSDNELFVAHSNGHSSYWWSQDQSGEVTVLDEDTLERKDLIQVSVDPFDLVVHSGYIYVSSGSGQWTYMVSYDRRTKQKVDQVTIRERSYLGLEPNKNHIYAVDTDTSPRDIHVFVVENGRFKQEYDSPYHGDYNLGTALKLSPDGSYIFNSYGSVFQSTYSKDLNMNYVTNIDSFTDLAFDPIQGLIVSAKGSSVTLYDDDTLTEISRFETGDDEVLRLFIVNHDLYLLVRRIPEGSNKPVLVWMRL